MDVTSKTSGFDRVLGSITDLYVDHFKMKGQNVKHKANELLQLLNDDYTFERLLQFFQVSEGKRASEA